MSFPNEIEKTKNEIDVLTAKLELLKEMENYKSPCEIAYKKVNGYYPVTDVGDAYWENFKDGYIAAQKDYKVGEYQEPEEEPEELKTLYQMFYDKCWSEPNCDVFCDIVKKWMSQFNPDDMGFKNLAYFTGFSDAIEELRSNLRQDTP